MPPIRGEVEEGFFGGGEAGEDLGAGQDAAVGEGICLSISVKRRSTINMQLTND